ncbi:hypothetical protein NBRC10512_003077 [Rhodotorula toruloides]
MSTPDPSHHDPSSPNPLEANSYFSPGASPALSASADPLDPFDPSFAHPPSPGASSTTSSSVVDSLAGAPYADVEARALEFLSASPPSTTPDPGFGWKDIPSRIRAPVPPTDVDIDVDEAQSRAIDYLRKMLDEAERDEWMYETPAVFGPPRAVGVEESRLAGREAVGRDALDVERGWTDRAFNIERWQVEGLGGRETGFDEGLAGFEGFETGEEGARFAEGEVGGVYSTRLRPRETPPTTEVFTQVALPCRSSTKTTPRQPQASFPRRAAAEVHEIGESKRPSQTGPPDPPGLASVDLIPTPAVPPSTTVPTRVVSAP